MKKKYISRKYKFYCILAIFLTLCLFFLCFRILNIVDSYLQKIDIPDDDTYDYKKGGRPEYLIDGKWYIQKNKVETFLLIGVDKYEPAIRNDNGYRNNEQSDALFLLAVDHKDLTYTFIHINRDTMANIRMLDINGTPYNSFEGQLALAHTYGSGREDSCENTVWSVSDYLYGLQIDHYASISMDAVAILNDKIGGVTVTILDDMTMIDESLSEGSTVTLKGNQALIYVRSRSELANSTNIERMKRQRQYVTEFINQAKEAIENNSILTSDILFAISDYLVSDITTQELLKFTNIIQNYTFTGIETIEGNARKGERYMEFYTDEASLKRLVIDTFYDIKS